MSRIASLLILMVLFSCIEEIDLELPENNVPSKVIEGYVERDKNHYHFWAQVSLTQNVTGEFKPAIIDAEINLLLNGSEVISLSPKMHYQVPIGDFHQLYGGNPETAVFQLMAKVEGQTYLSEEQQIIGVPTPDSLTVETEDRVILNTAGNITSTRIVKLLVHTPLRNDRDELVSLNWVVGSTFEFVEGIREDPDYQTKTCYSTSNIYQNDINIAAVQDYPGKTRVDDVEIAITPSDFRFSIALYFTVVQKSLNQETIEYWKEVKASNQRSGNLYDVFPGRIRTNIVNQTNPDELVTGFFQVSEVDTIRLKVRADQAGFPLPKCALWEEPMIIEPNDPDPCLNCLNLGNSTLVRPSYWR